MFSCNYFLKILIACVYSILWLLLGLYKEQNNNKKRMDVS